MRPDTPMHLDGADAGIHGDHAPALRGGRSNVAGRSGRCLRDERAGARRHPSAAAVAYHRLPGASLTFTTDLIGWTHWSPPSRRARAIHTGETMAGLLERLTMVNSVPGPDVLALVPPPPEGIPSDEERQRYASVSSGSPCPTRLTVERVYPTQFSASTLTPSTGLISTVHDYAQFDLALRGGILVQPETRSRRPGARARRRSRQAAAAWDWMVRAEVQRGHRGLAIRHRRRQRLVVAGGDAAARGVRRWC